MDMFYLKNKIITFILKKTIQIWLQFKKPRIWNKI